MGLTKYNTIRRLSSFPVGLFGSTVAMAGLGSAFKMGQTLYGIPESWDTVIIITCWIVFITLIASYALKWFIYPGKVIEELTHPISAHFAGTFFISTVLISALTTPFSMPVARVVWLAGTIGGFIFLYVMTSRLLKGNLVAANTAPALLIPGLTVLNAATAGAAMKLSEFGHLAQISLFSMGIVYTFTFFVLIASRIVHEAPLNNFLRPSLLLMCAPFEIGFQTYISIAGHVDLFATGIFYFGLFIYAVLFFHVFTRSLRFETSWWGACFSTGALTNAALHYAILNPDPLIKVIAAIMIIVLTGLILLTAYYSLSHLFFPRSIASESAASEIPLAAITKKTT